VRRGGWFLLLLAASGTASLLAALAASREAILERWHLSRLEGEDEVARSRAREWIAARGAARSVGQLLLLRDRRLEEGEGGGPFETGPDDLLSGVLDRLGRRAAPVLERYLAAKERRGMHVLETARVLLGLDPSNRAALGTLIAALKSTEGRLRERAQRLLVVAPAGLVIPDLLDLLRSRDAGQRLSAIAVLSALGSPAEAAVPELLEALEDDALEVRVKSAEALLDLGREAEVPLPLVLRWAAGEEEAERTRALGCVWRLGPRAREAIPALVALLRRGVQVELASDALAVMGEEARAPLAALLSAEDPAVRERARRILERLAEEVERGGARGGKEGAGGAGPSPSDPPLPALPALHDRAALPGRLHAQPLHPEPGALLGGPFRAAEAR
jgi:hypothetical protein